MRADEEDLPSEGPSHGDVLIGLLAGFLEELQLPGHPIRQFACDVDELGINICANDHGRRAHAFPPVCLSLRTSPNILRYTARWHGVWMAATNVRTLRAMRWVRKQVRVDTIPDAIWARISQPELRALRETPLPAYGVPDAPSGLRSVNAGVHDRVRPNTSVRMREAWATLEFSVPPTSKQPGAPEGLVAFGSEQLRPRPGEPPDEQLGESQARLWRRDGAAQIANRTEMPDVEALSPLIPGLHLVIDQLLLGDWPHQAFVAMLPEITPQVHTILIRLYGGPAFVRIVARGIPLQQLLALIEGAVDVQMQPDLLLQYDRELHAHHEHAC
jgi:hypothetical protein